MCYHVEYNPSSRILIVATPTTQQQQQQRTVELEPSLFVVAPGTVWPNSYLLLLLLLRIPLSDTRYNHSIINNHNSNDIVPKHPNGQRRWWETDQSVKTKNRKPPIYPLPGGVSSSSISLFLGKAAYQKFILDYKDPKSTCQILQRKDEEVSGIHPRPAVGRQCQAH